MYFCMKCIPSRLAMHTSSSLVIEDPPNRLVTFDFREIAQKWFVNAVGIQVFKRCQWLVGQLETSGNTGEMRISSSGPGHQGKRRRLVNCAIVCKISKEEVNI